MYRLSSAQKHKLLISVAVFMDAGVTVAMETLDVALFVVLVTSRTLV